MTNLAALIDTLIRDETQGLPRHEIILELGDTPELLRRFAGFPAIGLGMKAKVISKAVFEHAISANVLKRLPEILGKPKALYQSDTRPGSAVVMTFETQAGAPIIIPLAPNQPTGRSQTRNLVLSVYGKSGPDPEIKWRNRGLELWHS